jgi:hypothetical protein
MNRTLTFAAMLILAAPLFAADPKPVANPTQQPVQGDSPLVAAAKRTGRLGKKPAFVITNDNLVTSGGHFTTTTSAYPVTPGSVQGVQAPATTNATPQPAKQKAETERQKLTRELQMQYEGASLNGAYQDPASIEHHLQVMQTGTVQPARPDQLGTMQMTTVQTVGTQQIQTGGTQQVQTSGTQQIPTAPVTQPPTYENPNPPQQ